MKSDSGSSFPGAQNASVVISKFSVNRDVHSSLWENKPSSYWVYIVRECSSVDFEQNPVQAALLVRCNEDHGWVSNELSLDLF